MDWAHDYQLFLFDFDGLLVNSEEIHYLAYKRMCAARGVNFDWDFNRYCQAAHYEADALRIQLYEQYPELHQQEPNWDVLYQEKKEQLKKLFHEGAVQLMPGAEQLLHYLKKHQIRTCVVTHSADDLVSIIRKQNPILNTIPNWVTREQYTKPKPNSECYLKAIEMLAAPTDRVIGFEDTPRGIRALMGTRAQPCLVCRAAYPEIAEFLKQGVKHYPSLADLPLGKGNLHS
ncbi:MAG: HAD family phosphatase [Parachlamydiaceae bacterium]|nr:HAD family phosphatase [Parachlamydiaceae bacterium]